MKSTNASAISGLVCLAVVFISGCASMTHKQDGKRTKFGKVLPWTKDRAPDPYPNPARMATTWTPDTLLQAGRTPTRGFGGRLFFYDEKTHAVPVDGELTVHAFSEPTDGSKGEVKRYVFTAEQFTSHFSQTDLGASYSIWIPWDAVGGEQQRITLVPSFKSASGKIVQGEQAIVGLPGKRQEQQNVAKTPSPTEAMLAKQENGKSGLITTTIPTKSSLPMRSTAPLDPASFPSATGVAKVQTTTKSFPINLTTPPQAISNDPVQLAQGMQPSLDGNQTGTQAQAVMANPSGLLGQPGTSASTTHFQRTQVASAHSAKTPLYARPHPQRLGTQVVSPEKSLGTASDPAGQVQPASASLPMNSWQQ